MADPVLDYIQNKVFTDYVIKHIAPEAAYKGIVGFKRGGYQEPILDQPSSPPEKKRMKEKSEDLDVDSLDNIMKQTDPPVLELSKLCIWTPMDEPKEPKLDPISWQNDKALEDKVQVQSEPEAPNGVGSEHVDSNVASASTTHQAPLAPAIVQQQHDSVSKISQKNIKDVVIPPVAVIGSLYEKHQGTNLQSP